MACPKCGSRRIILYKGAELCVDCPTEVIEEKNIPNFDDWNASCKLKHTTAYHHKDSIVYITILTNDPSTTITRIDVVPIGEDKLT